MEESSVCLCHQSTSHLGLQTPVQHFEEQKKSKKKGSGRSHPYRLWGDYVAVSFIVALSKSRFISEAKTPCRFRKIGGTEIWLGSLGKTSNATLQWRLMKGLGDTPVDLTRRGMLPAVDTRGEGDM